jgi:hypothetical protein
MTIEFSGERVGHPPYSDYQTRQTAFVNNQWKGVGKDLVIAAGVGCVLGLLPAGVGCPFGAAGTMLGTLVMDGVRTTWDAVDFQNANQSQLQQDLAKCGNSVGSGS